METKAKIKKIAIIILIIIIVIAIILGIKFLNNKEEVVNPEEETQREDIFDYSDSQIDMNNTKNAEVKNGLKTATSPKLQEEKIYNDIRIIKAEITATKNRASFIADVKNDWEKEIQGEEINVIFLNKDGSEMTRIETYFPDLAPNGEGQITLSTNQDIANAYDYRIERKA